MHSVGGVFWNLIGYLLKFSPFEFATVNSDPSFGTVITISSPKLDSTENHPYLARNSGALFITASVVVPKKTC